MKHLHVFAALACAAVLMTACSEDQTSFNINRVPYKTQVEGKIVYNQGTSVENGKFVYNYVPAANLDVYVILPNNQYDSNLSGQTVLTTKTDAEGRYKLEIPCDITGGTAQIRTAQFLATCKKVVRENNKLVTKEETAVFGAQRNVNLSPAGYSFADMECQGVAVSENPESFNQYALIKGQVGRNVELYRPAEQIMESGMVLAYKNAQIKYAFEPASGIDIIVTVNYAGYSESQSFNVTTDAQGNYELSVPVKEFPATFTYSLDIIPVQNATFTHYVPKYVDFESVYGAAQYVDYDPVELKGWYEQTSWTKGLYNASFPVAAVTCSEEVKGLVFHPLDGDPNADTYSPSYFTSLSKWKADIEEEEAQEAEEGEQQD